MRINASTSQPIYQNQAEPLKEQAPQEKKSVSELKTQLKSQEEDLNKLLESFNNKFGNMKNPLTAGTTGKGGVLDVSA